jgi:hypothetical protein
LLFSPAGDLLERVNYQYSGVIMKNKLSIVTLAIVLLFAFSAMAHEKVVVIPLGAKKDTRVPVVKTGQTPTFPFTAVTGSDGDLQKGVAWPTPRFSDNSNGTVTDNLTGLIWLANANCTETVGGVIKNSALSWSNAITWSNNLASGDCGLTDSSEAGDWRLPNIFELESLRALQYFDPALSNDAGTAKWAEDATSTFSNVQRSYWSSTTAASNANEAFYVDFYYPVVGVMSKDDAPVNNRYVWPVRD